MSYKTKRTPSKKKRNKTVKGGMFGRAAETSRAVGKGFKNLLNPLINPPKTTKEELEKYMKNRNKPNVKLTSVGLEQKSEEAPKPNSEEPTQVNKPLGTRIGGYYKCKNKNKSKRK